MACLQPNLIIRPVDINDLAALYDLAVAAGVGFTSLPANKAVLRKKVQLSEDSFTRELASLTSEYYLMVAEDSATGRVVGCSAIAANVGHDEVFYTYKVGRLTKACQNLDIRIEHQTLTLTTDYQGSTELCTLFLMPACRQHFGGQLLSRCRFLFLAEFKQRFNQYVIAEMRGVSDESGVSPFWEAIGQHFFGGVKYPQADYLTGLGEKQFIADLMPEFCLYTCMLPQAAQDVIGQVHDDTKSALAMLKKEGFNYRHYVDLFDGGPTVEARLERIQSVKHNQRATISSIDETTDGKAYVISNTRLNFRACIGTLQPLENGLVMLPKTVADALQVTSADSIRYMEVN